jgi:hypothetical protein
MMAIGVNVSRGIMQCDLLMHPERYFFIHMMDHRASLCIRTCDAMGKSIQVHVLDGFSFHDDGCGHSVFSDLINDAVCEMQNIAGCSSPRDEYPLSFHLSKKISGMPDMMEWIVSTILSEEKNLIIYSGDL